MKRKEESMCGTPNGGELKYGKEASVVLSIMYGLFLVVLAVVFKVSENITTTQNKAVAKSNISKNYLCVLFAISLMWLIGFKVHSEWSRKQNTRQIFKSPHASNKWLKAIVAIFGFSVVVKESLELIGVTEIHNPKCEDKLLYFITPIFHSLFALGQVVFLFFYAKIHIQDFTSMSRLGIMHAMASNLAVWISIVSDETNHALAYERYHHNHSSLKGALEQLNYTGSLLLKDMVDSNCNVTDRLSSLFVTISENTSEYTEGLFKGECFCHSAICSLVARADQFLSPMLIEFCLIASCLLYVTWSNVGKQVKHHPLITKPSYKFYKSYKGVMMGTLILLGSVIVMTLLASIDSGVSADLKSYATEYKSLVIFDSFLTLCNILTLVGCIAGFYVFSLLHSPKRKDFQAGLDVVLLFICLFGPLLVGLFSILSLSAGTSESKQARWQISLASSISDIVVSVVQILFIVYGFSREPSTQPLSIPCKSSPELYLSEKSCDGSLDDLKEKDDAKLVVANHQDSKECMIELDEMKRDDEVRESVESSPTKSAGSQGATPPVIKVSEWDHVETDMIQDSTSLDSHIDANHLLVPSYKLGPRNSRTMDPLMQRPAPRKKRIILRDIMMFLVISNSCLWMLLSLNGTAYKVYTYQREYFGHSAWTTLASVTAPLSIFLKLHFAACFFEIWSYS